ncbi:SPOR domain-containing protein [Qipengyuania zhejiangensis]|uniref:SPOR domain-containing protein n=1 Tax=Qipengyuania zhejiangensis TaxID=3077782 RepID=UPI002D77AEBA|nr:SPOR domain-containing protein [Qipengyuania sp. Z2]
MRFRTRFLATPAALAGAAVVGACSTNAQEPAHSAGSHQANGPAADYPIVIGEPFEIDGVTHTPLDMMNYDHVGYAGADRTDATGVTAAHRTLPLPSYVEVTSLETGRTVLLRLERRGPMSNARLIALSPAALDQLDITDGAPVRVRRVNPPEEHRAMLRAGDEAPLRMDTPPGLLDVLRRRLPDAGSSPLSDAGQIEAPKTAPSAEAIGSIDPDTAIAALDPGPVEDWVAEATHAPDLAVKGNVPTISREASDIPQEPPVAAGDAKGRFAIQLGAFAVRSNADRLARAVDGYVETSGRFALVRVGPFSSGGQAAETLAKLRGQGYSDAVIKTLD